ncbi:MAG: hypothetical protein H6621_05730 [Halobacteriovoraceae bacterium]|nr:hypothetical protein [Halobacteriovoraceae bacterium]
MNSGQALLEYLLVVLFAVLLLGQTVNGISDSMGNVFGNLAHHLSYNLKTGICESNCFFGGYRNDNRNE